MANETEQSQNRLLTQAINHPDRAAAKCAFEAMMEMHKIEVAAIEAAWRG